MRCSMPSLMVKSIQWERSAAGYTVYNLLVQDDHTYFVGNGQEWVHNGPNDCKTTVIGRMNDIKRFAGESGFDTWWDSGPPPIPPKTLVSWAQNKVWLNERIARGDSFWLATDPSTFPIEYVPGNANGWFTKREYDYLTRLGIPIRLPPLP